MCLHWQQHERAENATFMWKNHWLAQKAQWLQNNYVEKSENALKKTKTHKRN